MFVELIEDHFTHFTAAKFDHNAHSVFIRLIAKPIGRNAFNHFIAIELNDALNEACFIDLIGKLGDDDGVAIAFFIMLNGRTCANDNASTAGMIGLTNAFSAINNRCGREIRCRNIFHQFIDGNVVIMEKRKRCVDGFR